MVADAHDIGCDIDNVFNHLDCVDDGFGIIIPDVPVKEGEEPATDHITIWVDAFASSCSSPNEPLTYTELIARHERIIRSIETNRVITIKKMPGNRDSRLRVKEIEKKKEYRVPACRLQFVSRKLDPPPMPKKK